ncbi:hypothetical protein KXD40_008307 [Peronospora effusa]|uniref:Peroxisome membrane anchor protein Pex14p N-terminal domain-containing protein n=1 Tax=Peronospora effusa TaxID=542832 RepID=A0A3M6VDH9_9STRA|nr:hypothetical protein DD238_007245 [Peronospora effusa]UIZ24171.1 hypothetical protein KXD40_008307 [Peronospora effusa]
MTTPKDPSLLRRCEDFLFHPTVRTLSLAQRVDFLEKKGLSPEEITHCLKSVDSRNGLSQLTQRTAEHLASNVDIYRLTTLKSAPKSSFQLLQNIVKKYGVVMLLLMLLGYGCSQVKRRNTEQMLLKYEAEKIQRKKRLHSRVEALLNVVKQQQTQYNQAVKLLGARVTKMLAVEKASTKRVTMSRDSSSMTHLSRGLEFQALQSELLELKNAVVDTYVHPRADRRSVETKKEVLMLLRPTVTDKVVQKIAVPTQRVESSKTVDTHYKAAKKTRQIVAQPHKKAYEKQSGIRDHTTMSSEEITAWFERGQVEEELSTAGSYRLLFATK